MKDIAKVLAEREQHGSPEAKATLKAFNEKQTDWYGWCRKCGKPLTGSLKDMREHSCG